MGSYEGGQTVVPISRYGSAEVSVGIDRQEQEDAVFLDTANHGSLIGEIRMTPEEARRLGEALLACHRELQIHQVANESIEATTGARVGVGV